ncbi:DUF4432 family protein [Paenibacillus sp. Soil724D2]|uniref:DUF4432 family protein n=1 Tax=Paenibacillus sp. (strain Soil724D2) TaxID=1736392 RepID=UPI000715D276|nr:DUF4432 family protein [Paenibacillus sp. Soil724D2]KRE36466.1 hypothetical protein ASG85_09875 [Paenibacillus sp. Soil724D2]
MYLPRSSAARISCEIIYQGQRMAVLENEQIAVTLLLDQGGSIVEFRYKPLDVDVMYRAPWGMRTWGKWVPTTSNPRGNWTDHYPGGWQVIFPAGSMASTYKGAEQGMHGEASLMAWEYEVLLDTPDEVAMLMRVETQRLPFRMERELRLKRGSGTLQIRETVENVSPVEVHCMWGQHPAIGEPFLGPGLELHLPPCRITRSAGGEDLPGRVVPGTSGEWPYLPGREGQPVDLRRMPPREQLAADMLFAAELEEGWVAACNPQLGMGFGISWPLEVWPHLWIWQEFGGTTGAPWFGRAYTMGIEPFSSIPGPDLPGLAGAVANGTAMLFAPFEKKSITFNTVAFAYEGKLQRITPDGEVQWQECAKANDWLPRSPK